MLDNLFDVAVLLLTSAALNGASGVFVVPTTVTQQSLPSESVVAPAVVPFWLADPLVHDPFGLADWQSSDLRLNAKVDASLVPKLSGMALLQQLAILDSQEVTQFVETNPGSIHTLILDPPSARVTESWWRNLDLDSRRTLNLAGPEIVGNLPGIPFAERDAANRRLLANTIQSLEREVDRGIGRGARTQLHARLSMLHEVQLAVKASAGETPRSLINLDTVWPGRAAIAFGDLPTADYVSYLVPGMFFTIDGQVGDWADTASDLRDQQLNWLDVLAGADATTTGQTVAAVAWMGYQTPNVFNVGSEELADEGALYLESAMDALYNERGFDRPFVSLLAHSYGSTTAMKALTNGGFAVDAFAVVGSPGSDAQTVDELHVRRGNVFVGEASWDPVIGTAFFGSNPGSQSYGAHRMSVDGGTDTITNEPLSASFGHNEYFASNSESFRNMALIGIDREELATDGSDNDAEKTLALVR